MCIRSCLLLLVVVICGALTENVKVTVYYETHCPCSVSFIKKQLYPNYVKLNGSLTLELVPYGNTKRINDNGTVDFECKKDCRSMKIHACAISESKANTTINFISCLMDGKYTDDEIKRCVKNHTVNWPSIETCVTGRLANLLMDNFGYHTQIIGSAHIPAVAFNDIYDDDVSQKAREDFLTTVCMLFVREIPPACLKFNEITMSDTNDLGVVV